MVELPEPRHQLPRGARGRDILARLTLWQDSWAYRVGLEKKFGECWAIRVGYYYDNTPQPDFDVSPLLPDNDRNVYTAGFGYNTERWGVRLRRAADQVQGSRDPARRRRPTSTTARTSETGLVLTAGIRLAL